MGIKKKEVFRLISLLFIVSLLLLSGFIYADSIDLEAGNAYYVRMESLFSTINWAGLRILNNGNSFDLSDSDTPFGTTILNIPVITQTEFPGANLKDGTTYYMAMQSDNFSLLNVRNITPADLASGNMFDSTNFPQFYPDYDDKNDNPSNTFCCTEANVTLGGANYTAFTVTLEDNVEYFVLKYDDDGTERPMFVSAFEDAQCFNATGIDNCVGQFLLPISANQYYFYLLSQFAVFDINVYVDDVDTNVIAQTALPYVVRLEVTDLYTSLPEPDLDVFMAENDAHNLFIPARLSGVVGEAFAIGTTNGSGEEEFLIAPSSYATNGNYTIFAGVLQGDNLANAETLTVTSGGSAVSQSKQVSPVSLNNEGKAAVNTMNQIISFMFAWGNNGNGNNPRAKQFVVYYELSNSSFYYSNVGAGDGTMLLKSGAPNVISVVVRNGGIEQAGYTYTVNERGGYLMLNPYMGTTPFTETGRNHRIESPATSSDELIIVPTELGAVDTDVVVTVLDSNGNFVANDTLTIDNSLDANFADSVFYNSNSFKELVNSMNIIVSSLFTAFNT